MCRNYFPLLEEQYFQRHKKSHSDAELQMFSQEDNIATVLLSMCQMQGIIAKMRRPRIEQIPQPKTCHSESMPIT